LCLISKTYAKKNKDNFYVLTIQKNALRIVAGIN